jgi:hypothetical protein
MIPNHGPDGSEKFLASRVGFIQDAPKIEHLLHFVFTSCGLKTGEREREEKKHTPSYFHLPASLYKLLWT